MLNQTITYFTNTIQFITPFNPLIFTIIGGVIVTIVGKFLIDPIKKQSEIIGEISATLSFYANIYTQPGVITNVQEASNEIRRKATELKARTNSIPIYLVLSKLRILIPKKNIFKAYDNLIRLSNSLGGNAEAERNIKDVEEIRDILKI